MKFKFLIGLISLYLGAPSAFAAEIVFHIPAGTAANEADWNDSNNPLVAHVGDTLILINDDSELHELHALGRPCEHGELIAPGGSWQTTLVATYDSRAEKEPLRDHVHSVQKFWLLVLP